jgi:ribonuclease D
VLSDDVLGALAKQQPDSKEKLHRVPGLHDKTVQRDGDDLLACIQTGKQLPKDQWPVLQRGVRLTEQQEAQADMLMAAVRLRCDENTLSPAIVINRKELAQLVSGDRDISVLHGWRGELVGNDLLALLEGKLSLQVVDGRLQLT